MDDLRPVVIELAPVVLCAPSKSLSVTWVPEKAEPTLVSLGWGVALTAKKVSANG
jgi:hypothetical protein